VTHLTFYVFVINLSMITWGDSQAGKILSWTDGIQDPGHARTMYGDVQACAGF